MDAVAFVFLLVCGDPVAVVGLAPPPLYSEPKDFGTSELIEFMEKLNSKQIPFAVREIGGEHCKE